MKKYDIRDLSLRGWREGLPLMRLQCADNCFGRTLDDVGRHVRCCRIDRCTPEEDERIPILFSTLRRYTIRMLLSFMMMSFARMRMRSPQGQ
jgi:hypothetical protein